MPKEPKSEIVIPLRIILVDPPPGIDFGIQQGKGNRTDGPPNFAGPISQGPPSGRFVYIDIGKSAGQFDSCWQRRIKIPLDGITWEMIDSVTEKPQRVLQATIPGTGKDGGPSCATLKSIDGWKVVKA